MSTSLARHAALINEKEEYAYRYSRLKSHSQYLLFDDPARPGGAADEVVGIPDRPEVRGQAPQERLQRVPLPDRGEEARIAAWRSGAACGPGTGVRSVQLQKGGQNSGPKVKTNSLGYFGVNRAVSGSYRFRAYDKDGVLLGTSRTAKPITG